MLKTRVLTAIALLPVVLGMLFLAGTAAWVAFAAAIALVSCWEWSRLCGFSPGARALFLAASGAIAPSSRTKPPKARPSSAGRPSVSPFQNGSRPAWPGAGLTSTWS